ncbi:MULTISPECIES: hypothetical protein [Acetobacter]|uniref:hypothetical protein n=1 Tax=Acetobacter TaxID=434 RepID=UPI0002D522E3|nr:MULTISPECIES: hypothetical protein [Acetobacter]AXC27581.1 hypothetical protein DS739_13085 [Acetobacter sp. JWB]KAA8387743.1 hypothetical protein FKW31_03650 [Acetobacter sp. DmW_136]KAA8426556.1 hypothetical protein FKW54_06935 [Acetobacter pomorum]KAA8436029.1 hypothetical protein FKW50_05795 [Acetobacter pomorum]KAA8454049.1 hypothetical protein FKW52_01835 [Acetobacter pomorum]
MSKKELKTEIEAAIIQAAATITAEFLRAHERNERADGDNKTDDRTSDLAAIYKKEDLKQTYKEHLDAIREAYLETHK